MQKTTAACAACPATPGRSSKAVLSPSASRLASFCTRPSCPVVRLLSACCPLVVRFKSGQQADNKRTDNKRTTGLPDTNRQAHGGMWDGRRSGGMGQPTAYGESSTPTAVRGKKLTCMHFFCLHFPIPLYICSVRCITDATLKGSSTGRTDKTKGSPSHSIDTGALWMKENGSLLLKV